MTGLTILLLTATIGFAVAQWLRLPVIPLLLVLGVIAGALTPSEADLQELGAITDIGLAFLVFFAGLSLKPERLLGQLRRVLGIALAQFAAAAGLGTLVALAMGFSSTSALYLGAALGTSSTLVVVRHLQRSAPADYTRLALGIVLVQDAALITLIAGLAHFDDGPAQSAVAIAVLALVVAVGVFLQRWLPRLATGFKLVDEEILLLAALAFLFLFAGAAATGGLTFVVGAFWAGFSLSGFPLAGLVRSVLDSLNTFFLAVFFVALGFGVELNGAILFPALALVGVLFAVTPILVTVLAEWKGGLTSRSAITTGLLVSQTSEFSVIMAIFGERLGHVSQEVVAIVTLLAVITMSLSAILATPQATRFLFSLHPLHRRPRPRSDRSGHVLVLGYGAAGRYVIKPVLDAGLPLVVIEQDPAVVRLLLAEGIDAIRGDAGDEDTLARAGAADAKFILAALPDPADVIRVIECTPGVPVIARMFEQHHADAIGRAGGIPVINALATADTFMDWFEAQQAAPKALT